jgi:predicted tellurium resistance membrane protein TerC
MVWGSTLILKAIERFPIIITIGAGVLAWTASKMIVDEPFLDQYFANPIVKYGFELLVVAGVIIAGTFKKVRGNKREANAANG